MYLWCSLKVSTFFPKNCLFYIIIFHFVSKFQLMSQKCNFFPMKSWLCIWNIDVIISNVDFFLKFLTSLYHIFYFFPQNFNLLFQKCPISCCYFSVFFSKSQLYLKIFTFWPMKSWFLICKFWHNYLKLFSLNVQFHFLKCWLFFSKFNFLTLYMNILL